LTIRDELDVDVIVLDQRMPGLTGMETARQLLARDPEMPIVLYSAHLDARVADEALAVGVRRCVQKGDVRSLISALRELTGLELDDPELDDTGRA
jgi:DNA-binding NarL/FixJ family response regulator